MSRKRVAVPVVALIVVLLVAFGAAGGWFSREHQLNLENDHVTLAPTDRILRFEVIARAVWGNVCGGHVALTVAPLKGTTAGLASHPVGPPPYARCGIVIAPRDSKGKRWSDEELCTIVVHEYGHLAGKGHSKNPRSVMFPKFDARNLPARCRR